MRRFVFVVGAALLAGAPLGCKSTEPAAAEQPAEMVALITVDGMT